MSGGLVSETNERFEAGAAALRSDLLAERAVLGTVLLDNDAIDAVGAVLSEEDFYHPAHSVIYSTMRALRALNEPIDILTLAAKLREIERLNTIGGAQYLGELTDTIATTAHVVAHATIVAEEARARRLIEDHQVGIARLRGGATSTAIAQELQLSLSRYIVTRGVGFERIDELVMRAFERIEFALERPTGVPGITTGLTKVDQLTGGDMVAELTLIAARPSMGKTALVLDGMIAAAREELRVAAQAGRQPRPILLFSLEMDKVTLVQRMLCSMGRVDAARLRTGLLDQDSLNALTRAANELHGLPIYINDNSEVTLSEMVAQCRGMHQQFGGLVKIAIDYAGLIRTGLKFSSRQEEMSVISRTCKLMVKTFQCPMDLLCQLNRGPEERSDHRPVLADLRESGALEQDADRVKMIYRDDYYHRDSEDRGIAEILLVKNRNGPVGTVRVRFEKQFTRFENLEEGEDPFYPAVAEVGASSFEGEGLPGIPIDG